MSFSNLDTIDTTNPVKENNRAKSREIPKFAGAPCPVPYVRYIVNATAIRDTSPNIVAKIPFWDCTRFVNI